THRLSTAATQLAHIAAGQALAAQQQVTAADRLNASLARGGRALASIDSSAREVEQAARATQTSAAAGEAISGAMATAMNRLAVSGATVTRELQALMDVLPTAAPISRATVGSPLAS
ncbi:MAG TPA: hypothetical protein VKY74_11820, partial [Chloroflexia bacterium]|nr:hypothetical protein [Chloroflexia bacterium]